MQIEDMYMHEKFCEQEERQGFIVSEVMKHSWAAYLKVLDEIQEICEKHGINIFACYGTLLGAVREHGFIPWDDDVDMGMLRDDYILFMDIISKNYADRYHVLNPYTRTWYNMNFSHIINSRDKRFDKEYLKEWCGCPFMIGMDIYPYYYIPRNKSDEEYILNTLNKIDSIIALYRQNDQQERTKEIIANGLVELQRETGYVFTTDRPMENQLEILYDQVCRITTEDEADFVARYEEYSLNKIKKFPKDNLKHTIYIPFEYTQISVPRGYDSVLKARFGDKYIIPRQEGGAHDYPFYRKQLDDEEYYQEEIKRKIKPSDVFKCDQIDCNEDDGDHLADTNAKHTRIKVLYHTCVREIMIYNDKAINTIKEILERLPDDQSNKEIWWMPDVFIKEDDYAMDMVAPGLIKKYEELIKEYVKKAGRLYDITDKYEDMVSYFDEYMGDDGFIAQKFRDAGKKAEISDYGILRDVDATFNDNKRIENKEADAYEPDRSSKRLKRSSGINKKSVLYVTTSSVLYEYQDTILDKIRYTLNVFKKRSEDISLIWSIIGLDYVDKDHFSPGFLEGLNDIIEEYKKEAWGVFDASDNKEIIIDTTDAFYGDADYIATKCIEKGIPVMLQNPQILIKQ